MRVLSARYEATPVSHRRFWSGSSVQYGFAQWSAIAPDPVVSNSYVSGQKQISQTPRLGMQNPNVKEAVLRGQAMHRQMNYGPNTQKEVTIAPGCRVDGIDFNNRIIYELKPNNPHAIARGISQLNRYTTAAHQKYGGEWTGILKLYD